MSNKTKNRFLMLIDSKETDYLLFQKPNAFRLLTIIAKRARRNDGEPDGLKSGQCHIGDWKKCGFTEREYRTAKSILILRRHLKIIETCRTRKKSTTGATTIGTLVELISSNVYDLNLEIKDDRKDDRATTERRSSDDELIKDKKERKKKEDNPLAESIPNDLSSFSNSNSVLSFDIATYKLADGSFLSQWMQNSIKKYTDENYEKVLRNVEYYERRVKKGPLAHHESYLQSCINNDYALKEIYVEQNLIYAEWFKLEFDLPIKIFKKTMKLFKGNEEPISISLELPPNTLSGILESYKNNYLQNSYK